MVERRLSPDEEPMDPGPRRMLPLAIAAGGVVLVLAGGALWLTLSGPLPDRGVAVALPAAPKAVEAPAEESPAPAPDSQQQAAAPEAPGPAPEPPAAKVEAPPPVPAARTPVANADTPQSLLPPPAAPGSVPAPAPGYTKGQALAPAPDVDLIERVATGYLPVIGRDGRLPWQVYARPFDLADKRPRVALIISSLGMSATQTDAAINHLPAGVTLAYHPYARKLGEWINLSRAAGHEVMLTLPMEPVDYPRNDAGPNGLLTALEPAKNMERFNWVLSQGTGYVGLVGYEGSRFTTARDDIMPMLDSMKKRGLLYVDNRETAQTAIPALAAELKLPFASSNRAIDKDATRAGVDKRLAELEDIARRNGAAVGIGSPFPVTFERVSAWAQGLEDRGMVLAPVSAVIGKTKEQVPQKGDAPGANKDVENAGGAAAPAAKEGAPASKEAAPPSKEAPAAGAKPHAAPAKAQE
ncbi:MAG TPA: divergent polysaccharide deacetylase family protein [Aliidongia sp.]|uniref:divergent polysaccharide deacetylase family protein n=1 Tax=Aliidongia sp. TaxID=1914230 RepID=UPI002DDD2770|nr:divergent polysaccharide deacetylase family protein [Aliidongia sp.]HEV2677840.1 divergent polysaccharide deacetylase family protein [Aliidongia sp.]